MTFNVPDVVAIGALTLPAFGYIITIERRLASIMKDLDWIKSNFHGAPQEDE